MADQLLDRSYSERPYRDVRRQSGAPRRGADPAARLARRAKRRRRLVDRMFLWLLRLACVALLAWGVMLESQSSFLQSLGFSRLTEGIGFTVDPGPSAAVRFPKGGPYDERLGYVQLPAFIAALGAHDFSVEYQAVPSPKLQEFMTAGGYALYHEKQHAGLRLLDRAQAPIYEASYPERAYDSFQAVPPLVANTLLFIEDRHLLDTDHPGHNPAVDWDRFALAIVGQGAGAISPALKQGGASTLATQIEKFRHSPGGRTDGISEKMRQMLTASARAYLNGPDTLEARQRILTAYLDATPLSSRPGFGEVVGIADGLKAWYGTDFADANHVLAAPAATPKELARKAEIYKQVLSLLLAERRPSYYLATDHQALEALADRHLRLLGTAGVIDPALRDVALKTELRFSSEAPAPPPLSFLERKATSAIRARLLSTLGAPSLYSLDRLDLTAQTTFDASAQERVTGVLGQLGDPAQVKALGLVGQNLLGAEDPGKVTYSVVLYERGADRNYLRIHADSLDQPFDINSGAKLILGSTAKLRTLITYLNIVTELHGRFRQMSGSELAAAAAKGLDPITRWAANHLASTSDRSLQGMLDAAMQRRYSGDPTESFFTGGGLHVFHNFEKSEDHEVPTVFEAFEHSVNLVFVRLIADVSRYYIAASGSLSHEVPADGQESAREGYLRRFADAEGSEYLNRFYEDYRGRKPDDALMLLAGRASPVPHRLAVVLRSVRPQATAADLKDFLAKRLPQSSFDGATIESLYSGAAVERFSLSDRGYLAGVHPLELWLATYLQGHPDASRTEMLGASARERQDVYTWLFKTRNAHAQDVRIHILQEEDAFNRILEDWRRVGYPFGHLVPSYATAIGSSGDRPAALAHLMGIIVNDGVELPTADIERVRFAAETPFETEMALKPATPKRVLAPEVAATVRQALMGVVREGTGTRARGIFVAPDKTTLAVGGKTGTGDNRYESFAAGGKLIESRVVDRTATFVFFVGDRFFGTITAFVPGAEAANYHFTSGLAVQLLKTLAPQLQPLIDKPVETASAQTGQNLGSAAVPNAGGMAPARSIPSSTVQIRGTQPASNR